MGAEKGGGGPRYGNFQQKQKGDRAKKVGNTKRSVGNTGGLTRSGGAFLWKERQMSTWEKSGFSKPNYGKSQSRWY